MPPHQLRQGSIVFAEVLDEHGYNPKTRRVVVVSPSDEILQNSTIVAVAITTKSDLVPTGFAVRLPYHPSGNCRTGLNQECVAACHWLVELELASIKTIAGHCPTIQLDEILLKILQ